MWTEEEIKEQYPTRLKLFDHYLVIHEQQFKNYVNGKHIKIYNNIKIPVLLLKDILENEQMYQRCVELYNNNSKELIVVGFDNDRVYDTIKVKMGVFTKAIYHCLEKYDIETNTNVDQKIEYFDRLSSWEQFKKDFENKGYEVDIEGKLYRFKVLELIEILNKDKKEFDDFFSLEKRDELIYGNSKVNYLYALCDMVYNHDLLEKYFLGNNMEMNYNEICDMEKIDFQSVNCYLKTNDFYLNDFEVNSLLEEEILKDMPENYTSLEKTIYIYIKLCDTLTYSMEYHAYDQQKKLIQKHDDIKRLNQITKDNNEVVCYEFNKIYGKFLDMLGIKFNTNTRSPKRYSDSHDYLKFRYDKYLLTADSVRGIITGDMVQIKQRNDIRGLFCHNKNSDSCKEVTEIINCVYDQYKKTYPLNTVKIVDDKRCENEIKKYRKSLDLDHEKVNFEIMEKFEGFIELLKNVPSGKNVDLLSIMWMLTKDIFNLYERDNYVDLTLVKEKLNNSEYEVSSSAVLTFNAKGYNLYPDENIYFKYNPLEKLKPIEKEKLNELFDNKILEEQSDKDMGIPGITREVKESHGQII